MGEPWVVDGPAPVAGRRPAGSADRAAAPARRSEVLEDEGAAGARRLAEHAHEVDHASSRFECGEEALGAAADRLEDRVAVAQVALGQQSLLARSRVREDDRELAGDVDEDRDLVLAPRARPGAVEPEDAVQLAVAEQRHVHERGDVALDEPIADRVEPGFRGHVLDDDRCPGLEALDVVGAPLDLVPNSCLPWCVV